MPVCNRSMRNGTGEFHGPASVGYFVRFIYVNLRI